MIFLERKLEFGIANFIRLIYNRMAKYNLIIKIKFYYNFNL